MTHTWILILVPFFYETPTSIISLSLVIVIKWSLFIIFIYFYDYSLVLILLETLYFHIEMF